MAEIKFSQLTTAAQLTNDDIFALAQMQGGSLSSVKTSMIAVANYLNTQVQYTTAYNTQAKTTSGAINELKQLISLIPQFAIEVVEELPTEDISDTTIYLVPAEDPEVGNYYEEYIHVNDAWELVGTTAVDLSAYYTKLEVDGLLATKASVTEVALKENKSDMPTDVRTIIKDCKTPKNATITNGIAQFECIEENLVKVLKVTMNPIQDLHGYSNPWAGGAGKNKLPPTGTTQTISGVTFTMYDDGTVMGNGTATADINYAVGTYTLKAGTAIKYNGSTGGTISTYWVTYSGYPKAPDGDGTADRTSATSDWIDAPIYIGVARGATLSNKLFKPMIRLASVSDGTFEPYENICPISGRTEASVTRTGKNLFDKTAVISNTYLDENGVEKTSSTFSVSDYLPVNPNEYVTYQGCTSGFGTSPRTCFYDAHKNFISSIRITAYNGTISVPNANYMRMSVASADLDNIMVEFGNSQSAYEPYTAETKTHQYSETIYGGVDDFVNGGATSNYGKIVFDGTEGWVSSVGRYQLRLNGVMKSGSYYNDDNVLCSAYPKSATLEVNNTIVVGYNSDYIYFYVTEDFPTLNDWRTRLQQGDIELTYLKATPTTISTSAEEITTVSGTNIISGTEPISECKYTELATVDDLIKIIGGQ